MQQRYWVVGGEYSDCRFKNLEPGTEKIEATVSVTFAIG